MPDGLLLMVSPARTSLALVLLAIASGVATELVQPGASRRKQFTVRTAEQAALQGG
jgi:hypothetical protein